MDNKENEFLNLQSNLKVRPEIQPIHIQPEIHENSLGFERVRLLSEEKEYMGMEL